MRYNGKNTAGRHVPTVVGQNKKQYGTKVLLKLRLFYSLLRPRVLLLYLNSIHTAICRPSDRAVGMPEIRGQDVLYRGRDTNH